jgi:hypothetical protein
MNKLTYIKGASQPSALLNWEDADGDPVDLNADPVEACRIGHSGRAATVTKTTGITSGAVFPNVTLTWSDELDTLDAGAWTLELETQSGRKSHWTLQILGDVS